MRRPHTHPCRYAARGCTAQISCLGANVHNDGYPAIVCEFEYYGHGATPACDDCANDANWCAKCDALLHLQPHAADCPEREASADPQAAA